MICARRRNENIFGYYLLLKCLESLEVGIGKLLYLIVYKNERRSKESCPKGMMDQDMGNGGLLTIHIFFLD